MNPQSRSQLPELGPNDLNLVIKIFNNLNTPNNQIRRMSEEKVYKLELQTGYCSILLMIIPNSRYPKNFRLLCAIMLKNFIPKYWRKKKPFAITEKEKNFVNKKILDLFCEKDEQILNFIGFCIAEIVSKSDEKDWFNFINYLTQRLHKTTNFQNELGLLLFVYRIIKRLIRKTLKKQKIAYEKLCKIVVNVIFKFWNKYVNLVGEYVKNGNFSGFGVVNCLQFKTLRITSKTVLFCLKYGINNFTDVPDISIFFQILLKNIIYFYSFDINCYKKNIKNLLVIPEIRRLINCFFKIPLRIQKDKPVQFSVFLLNYLEFSFEILKNTTNDMFNVHDMLLLKLVLFIDSVISKIYVCDGELINNGIFKPNETKEENKKLLIIYRKFFSKQKVNELIHLLITKYLLIGQQEVIKYKQNPEIFFLESCSDFPLSLKANCANLYVNILDTFDENVNYTVNLIHNSLKNTYGSFEFNKIQSRDSAYLGLGYGNYSLIKLINFNHFYFNCLRSELLVKDDRYKIIQKRVLWVCERWSEKHNLKCRMDFYSILMKFLNENDLVIKLQVCEAMRGILNGEKFNKNNFKQFCEGFLNKIFQILSIVKKEETKLKLFQTIKSIIIRFGSFTEKYSTSIVKVSSYFYNLSYSSNENLLKDVIVSLINCMVENFQISKIQNDSFLVNFIFKLLIEGTNPQNQAFLYVHEEAIELWKNFIQYSPKLCMNLTKLFPNCLAIIQRNYEHLQKILVIVKSYIMLGKHQFINSFSIILFKIFDITIGNVKEESLSLCTDVLDLLLSLNPKQTTQLYKIQFKRILDMIMTNKITKMVLSSSILLFSRIFQHDKNSIYLFFNRNNLQKFLYLWVDKHDLIYNSFQRKLSAISLLSFFPTNENYLFQLFPKIMNICVQVLYETDELKNQVLMMQRTVQNNCEMERLRIRYEQDYVYKLDFFQYLQNKMNQIKQFNGINIYNSLFNSLNRELIKQLNDYPKLINSK